LAAQSGHSQSGEVTNNNKQSKDVHRHELRRADGVTFGGTEAANMALQNAITITATVLRSADLSKRQFADVDRARRRQHRNFEMICLHNVCDVARAMRDNVDTGPASQAVIEQSGATSCANLLAKLLRGVIAVARITNLLVQLVENGLRQERLLSEIRQDLDSGIIER
jgi:hypothetical protein